MILMNSQQACSRTVCRSGTVYIVGEDGSVEVTDQHDIRDFLSQGFVAQVVPTADVGDDSGNLATNAFVTDSIAAIPPA